MGGHGRGLPLQSKQITSRGVGPPWLLSPTVSIPISIPIPISISISMGRPPVPALARVAPDISIHPRFSIDETMINGYKSIHYGYVNRRHSAKAKPPKRGGAKPRV